MVRLWRTLGRHGHTAAWMLLVSLVVGCGGGDVATLSGQVTYDGQPLADGNILLVPQQGTPSQGGGTKITGGAYEFAKDQELAPGKYQVQVSATRDATPEEIAAMSSDEESDEDDEESPEDAQPAEVTPKMQILPRKYNLESTLTVDLKAGENQKNFDLEK